jgi:hypothetical protein
MYILFLTNCLPFTSPLRFDARAVTNYYIDLVFTEHGRNAEVQDPVRVLFSCLSFPYKSKHCLYSSLRFLSTGQHRRCQCSYPDVAHPVVLIT